MRAILFAAALAASAATAHASPWVGWNRPTSAFPNSADLANQGSHNYVRVQVNQPSDPILLLFLPGTGTDNIGNYTDFLNAAASHGYYVLGLDYRHGQHHPHMVGCWDAGWTEYYVQQIYGIGATFWPHWLATEPPGDNSIDHRVKVALEALDDDHVGGVTFSWSGHFWDYANNRPKWENIVVAGHSQGGEMATYISRYEPVRGGLVFEGLYDRLNIGAPDAGLDFTKLAGPDVTPDCYGAEADVAPSWITPGDWVDNFFLITSKKSTAYDGTWPGHHIAATGLDAGKRWDMAISAAPSSLAGGWYSLDTPLNAGCNSGHEQPIVNGCYPAWMPDFWGMLLDRAKTIRTNPVPNPFHLIASPQP